MIDKVWVELVTPTRMLVQGEAEMVVVPGGEGDFGVLAGHAPLISTVRPGTVDFFEDGRMSEGIFVEGGFAEVGGDRCTVLAEQAMPIADLTRETIDARFARAREGLSNAASEGERRDAEHELRIAEAMAVAAARS